MVRAFHPHPAPAPIGSASMAWPAHRSGTVTLRYTVAMGARPGKNVGTFEVVKGSGTGGLAAAQGRGTIVATPDPATGTVTSAGTLRVNCKDR
ncbi:MAG: DUF3224 domain-containing protein [Acidimicrobiales bacterium]